MPHKLLITTGAFVALSISAQAVVLYTQDFDDATNPAAADFDSVTGLGSSSIVSSADVDGYRLDGQAASNSSLFTANTGATTLTLQFDVTYQSDGGPWLLLGFSEGNVSADTAFNFGTGGAAWRFRQATVAGSTSSYSAVGHPASSNATRTDTFSLVFDGTYITSVTMNDVAIATDLITGSGYNTGYTGDIFDLHSIYLRGGSGAPIFDNIVVSDNVPEPSSAAALLGLGALALVLRRRK